MRVHSFLPVVLLGAVLLPSEAWSQCQTASAAGTPTHNTAFAAQTGTFTVEVDATPGAAAMDGGVGLSRGSQSGDPPHSRSKNHRELRGIHRESAQWGRLHPCLSSPRTNPDNTPKHYRACRAARTDWQDKRRRDSYVYC